MATHARIGWPGTRRTFVLALAPASEVRNRRRLQSATAPTDRTHRYRGLAGRLRLRLSAGMAYEDQAQPEDAGTICGPISRRPDGQRTACGRLLSGRSISARVGVVDEPRAVSEPLGQTFSKGMCEHRLRGPSELSRSLLPGQTSDVGEPHK